MRESRPIAHDVFISYAFEDRAMADAVCATLEGSSIRCWIAPRDIPPGVEFPDAVSDGVDQSRLLVLVFTSNSNGAPHVLREVEQAVSKGNPVLAFRGEDTQPQRGLGHLIGTSHWLDALTPPLEQHLKRLTEAVGYLLAQADAWAPSLAATTRLRRFLDSLAVVDEDTWNEVKTMELTFQYGGYAEERPPHPEGIEQRLHEIEGRCALNGVRLPEDWREGYWSTGRIKAISTRDRDAAMTFLASGDDELLRIAEALTEGATTGNLLQTRFVRAELVARLDDAERRDLLIRKAQTAGLLSEGIPRAPPGRSSYFSSMRYQATSLVAVIHRLLGLAGLSLSEEASRSPSEG
jgi:TIR domain